jgi:hypothetical protein
MYTQLRFTTFDDSILRNGYISSNVNADSIGRIDPASTGMDKPIQWTHDGDRQGIVYDPVDKCAYRLNASWDSTIAFVQSLLNTS